MEATQALDEPDPSLSGFAPYVTELEQLAYQALRTTRPADTALMPHLDGQAGRVLRRTVELDLLRQQGAFFTGEQLSTRAAALVHPAARYFDGTCGCGDLLLAVAQHLPVHRTVAATLRAWNRRLSGIDCHEPFVRAARARLALHAASRGAQPSRCRAGLEDLLPAVRVGDLFAVQQRLRRGSALLLNPPYGLTQCPADVDWSSGRVSAAAVFAMHAQRLLPADGKLVAILPDVLRSGSRYARWRTEIERRTTINHVDVFGQFDALTDVDVFLLVLTGPDVASGETVGWQPTPQATCTISRHFAVSVGAVVDFRSPQRGPVRPYLVGKGLPVGGTTTAQKRREFDGKLETPPFVVVARTGRPGDRPRARASVVLGNEPVAVENHLVVLRPLDGTQSACERLLGLLESEATSEWLDRRIRCRHLTVGALKNVPWTVRGDD
jgi:hypothetical protein